MEYKITCKHREGWGFYQAVAIAKIEYYEMMKKLSEELGLFYHKADLPVSLTEKAPKKETPHETNVFTEYPGGYDQNTEELGEDAHRVSQDDIQVRRRTTGVPSIQALQVASPLGSPESVKGVKSL